MFRHDELSGFGTGYNETQDLLRRGLREVLQKEWSSALVRTSLEDPATFHRPLWESLLRGGWIASLFPDRMDGQALPFEDFAPALAELGAVLAPGPFFSSAVLVPIFLNEVDPDGELLPHLSGVSSGSQIATVALWERPLRALEPAITAVVEGAGISGTKHFVPDASFADTLLVLTHDERQAPALVVVDTRSSGVEVTAHPTLAGRNVCTVGLAGAAVRGFLRRDGLLEAIGRAVLKAAVAVCGLQVGGAQVTVAAAADYARNRVQFGRPIGSFQAVSHRLADMYCRAAVGRSLWLKAARSLTGSSPDWETDASAAKLWNNMMYETVTVSALQIFAGIGYTYEHDIHLYLRMARALAAEYGSTAHHRRRLKQSWLTAVPAAEA